jgi:branched-chain amino acid transport system substrate-binding protein
MITSRKAISKIAIIVILAVVIVGITGIVYLAYRAATPVKEKVIKIGVSTPLSGPSAYAGDQQRKGAILAAEEINAAGGIKLKDGFYKIELIIADDESKPEVGVSVFERFVTQENVQIVIGQVNTPVALAVMDVSAKYKVPYISLGPSTDVLTDKYLSDIVKYKYYIRMTPLSAHAYANGSAMFLEYAISKGWFNVKEKKLAILGEDTDYGIGNSKAFKEVAENTGWKVVVYEIYKRDQEDFTPILLKIKDRGAEVVWYIGVNPGAAAAFTKQFMAMGIKAYLIGIFIMQNPPYIDLVKDLSHGIVWGLNSLWSSKVPYVREFIEKFKARWREEPLSNAGLAYDTIYMIKQALEKIGEYDPDKFVDAFLSLTYRGSTGYYVWIKKLHCPEFGPDKVPASFAQIQWKNGSYYHEYLWPPQFFPDAKFITPPWLKEK